MKVCIPVRSPDGLQSSIEPRLQDAEHLLFVDMESRRCEHIALGDPQGAGEFEIDALLCAGVNRITLRSLTGRGITVYRTTAGTVGQAIVEFDSGKLSPAEADGGACHGHGHNKAGGGCAGHGEHEGAPEAHQCQCEGSACGGDHHHGERGGCCGGTGHKRAEKSAGDTLTIAVCSQNRKQITDHAGKCRKFWVYETWQNKILTKSLLELSIDESYHAMPAGQPHALDQIDVLLAAGMGEGLQQKLLQRGVQAIVTAETDPDLAVEAFLARTIATSPVG